MIARGLGYAGAALIWAACADDSDSDGVDLSRGCDIREAACQRAVFDATAAVREQPGASLPSVRTIDLTALADDLQQRVDDQRDAESAGWTAAFQLVGLLSPRTDLGDAVVSSAVESVAAYYDGATGGITVVDRDETSDPLSQVFLLAHEFVHALQDQEVDLSSFREDWVDSTDSDVATTTLIEGEAVVLSAGVMEASLPPTMRLEWHSFTGNIRDSIFEAIEASDEPFIDAVRQLPYTAGTAALSRVFRSEGAAAIKQMYAMPKTALIEWTREGGLAQRDPVICLPTEGPPGYEARDHDTLGVAGLFGLELIATEGSDRTDPWFRAQRWTDDVIVVFRAADGSAHATAWRIRLRTVPDALELVERLEALDTGARVVASAREVLIFGASEPGVAETWTRATDCGSEADLPERPDEDERPMASLLPR